MKKKLHSCTKFIVVF